MRTCWVGPRLCAALAVCVPLRVSTRSLLDCILPVPIAKLDKVSFTGALNFNIEEAVSTHLYDTISQRAPGTAADSSDRSTFLNPASLTPPASHQSPTPSQSPVPAPHNNQSPYGNASRATSEHQHAPPHSPMPHAPVISGQLTVSRPLRHPTVAPELPPPGPLARLLAFLSKSNMPYTAAALHIPAADISPKMPTHAPLAQHTGPAQPAACALAATRATQAPVGTTDTTAELSMSIALHPPASTSINRRVPGQPTASHELEPGPFHRANAALRRQLPLCNARVHVTARWDHIAVFAAAAVAFGAYAGVRFVDLVFGRGAGFSGQDVSAALSWVALVADVLGGLAGLYARPLFWKQTVEYTPVVEEDVEDMATVRSCLRRAAAVRRYHVLLRYALPAVLHSAMM